MSNVEKSKKFAKAADMLLLGGSSAIVWLIFRFIELDGQGALILAMGMMFLANFVNHPHFVHSYQMFFEIWPEIRQRKELGKFRTKWLVTAIIVPLVLAIFLGISVIFSLKGDFLPMQLCLGAYAVLVGWHYVKQSFGMALLDAARNKVYWSAKSRKTLLWNSYVSWIAALVIGAHVLAGGDFWGIKFLTPDFVDGYWTIGAAVIASISGVWTSLVIWHQISSWRNSGVVMSQIPFTGIIGYLVGIYLWTLLAWLDYKYILVIPFFHSLQYLVIVARYQKGKNKINFGVSRLLSPDGRVYVKAVILGGVFFWLLPGVLDYLRGGKLNYFSGGIFIFTAAVWIFINIHHYFIDSVIWKKENPLMGKYIFSHDE